MKILLPLLAAGILGLAPSLAPAEEALHPFAVEVSAKLPDAEQPFVMIVDLKVRSGQAEALVAAMTKPTLETLKEPGNAAYELSKSVEQADTFVLYEKWQNVSALDAHLKQPYLTELLAAFDKLLAEPPKLTVLTPSRSSSKRHPK